MSKDGKAPDPMDNIMKQFDYPLPVIDLSADKISAECSSNFSSVLRIRNVAGGTLSGRLRSDKNLISFSPDSFSGNEAEIELSCDISAFKPGENIKSEILIVSNGGERVIPVSIDVVPPEIISREGIKISSLRDFMFYVKSKPVQSRQLFTQPDFMMWLAGINYEHMDLYDRFVLDPNKERAVDNFLILNKRKRKATVSFAEQNLTLRMRRSDREAVTGVIPLKLNGWGYIEAQLEITGGGKAVKLMSERLSYSDFDENGFFEAMYVVYPALLEENCSLFKVSLSGSRSSERVLTIIKEKPFTASLTKLSYANNDSGQLIIENTTGRDMRIEISSDESFIHFEGRKYFIAQSASIPFEIKLPVLQTAQLVMRKQSHISGAIIKVRCMDDFSFHEQKLELEVKLGE
jgi:hypothetical protein